MTTVPIGEETYAEEPALEWLRELGWEYEYGPDIAPGAPGAEREAWDDVVLVDRLRAALVELNPDASRGALGLAVERVLDTASPDPIRDHLDFHELLVAGVPVTVLEEGEERALRVKLVDWQHRSATTSSRSTSSASSSGRRTAGRTSSSSSMASRSARSR